jgi:hypothetical protein
VTKKKGAEGKEALNGVLAVMPPTTRDRLDELKQILQSLSPHDFEKLTAALLSRLLGVGIAVAKSGYQFGGDAGPAGRQDRNFRIECKRYADDTKLNDRELLGEIDEAVAAEPALEAWFLAATRSASEQLENLLKGHAEKLGVPVLVIDWKPTGFPALGALCSGAPEVLESFAGESAAELARGLALEGADALKSLLKDISVWNLGYYRLRQQSHQRIQTIWSKPKESRARLNQDVAGGDNKGTIPRTISLDAITAWWAGKALQDSPAVILGNEGVGKTWAVFDWLQRNQTYLPIILAAPSSSVRTLSSTTEVEVRRYLGDRLFELTGSRDADHWRRRLDRLLQRPTAEGPVITLFIDGLNQQPSADWLPLLQALQGDAFAGRVRVITTTRDLHFKDRLRKLTGLDEPATRIHIDRYEMSDGGELDQRLKNEGLSRSDLPGDLLDLARTPRLFTLVVALRVRLKGLQHVTVHTLLWEHGRDTVETATARSFDEQSWKAWLQEIAAQYLSGTRTYTLGQLSTTTARPDLSSDETARRLSDIIDGNFATQNANGQFRLIPTIVDHALGSAIIATLDELTDPSHDSVEQCLAAWFDPINGLDQKADILRAAVSILLARDETPRRSSLSGLLGEWLRTQNIPEQHRAEITRLAEPLCDALIDVLWRNEPYTQNLVNEWTVAALRSIPRDNLEVFQKLVFRLTDWLQVISRDVEPANAREPEANASRTRRFIKNLGFDESGQFTVLGQTLSIVDHRRMPVKAAIPALLDGYPLRHTLPLLEAAAVHMAILDHDECWDGLKWLVLLNSIDAPETSAALRARAAHLSVTAPEPHVAQDLAKRVAALLLWMTGEESADEQAAELNPRTGPSYEERYLNDPLNSHYALERRHVDLVFRAPDVPLFRKYRRLEHYFPDPDVNIPDDFSAALAAEAEAVDVSKLDTGINVSSEDHNFERLAPIVARCAPTTLARLIRKKLAGFETRPATQRFACAVRSNEHILLADETSASAARALRLSSKENTENDELFAESRLLAIEILHLPGPEQIEALIAADLKYIVTDLEHVLRPLTASEVSILLDKYESAPEKQSADFLLLLSAVATELDDRSWNWVSSRAFDGTFKYPGVAFEILCGIDAQKLGRELASRDWSWSQTGDPRSNHFGSFALIAATDARPFDQIVSNIAPWLILKAVSERGSSAEDTQLAAEVLGNVLNTERPDLPDLGSDITVDSRKRASDPFVVGIAPHVNNDDPFRALLQVKDDADARQRAVDKAWERIRAAQKSGASLYLHTIDPINCRPLLEHAAASVAAWLEGMSPPSASFQRRVRLAEGLYMGLCEALLEADPPRGEQLWHALRVTLRTRYKSGAGVDEFTNMVFRAPRTPDTLLEEQLALSLCNTDEAAFNLVLSAQTHGRTAWLEQVLLRERSSGVSWRLQRARLLGGFLAGSALPVPGVWLSGEIKSTKEYREWEAAKWKHKDACAHYWWDRFWSIPSDDEAYAAWTLMLETADRRADVWMRPDVASTFLPAEVYRRRLIHCRMNNHELVQAMKKNSKGIFSNFLGRRIVEGVGPWP